MDVLGGDPAWRSGRLRDSLRRLRPDGPVRPDVDLRDRPDAAGLDDLDGPAQTIRGRALIAHLRADLVLPRRLRSSRASKTVCVNGFWQ